MYITPSGFQFGAAKVKRLASHKRYVVIGIETPKQMLQVTVTPTGVLRVSIPRRNVRAADNE
jgi:hypothetical protein